MADELMDVGAVAWWPLEKIVPYARNAKEHGEAQVAQLAGMIKEFGWTYPILVDEEGVILAGHKRRLACERLELTQAPVLVKTGLTAHQKQAYRIADNKTTENSPWDADLLRVELGELKEAGADLGLTGFDDAELREFFGVEEEPPPDPGPQIDRAEELREKWQVEAGQMWQLGEHRLICGDCTDAAVVERVMGGEKAELCVTDPPYGIAIARKSNNFGDSPDKSRKATGESWDDCKVGDAAFLNMFASSDNQIVFGANYYWDIFTSSGCYIVWDKRGDLPDVPFSPVEFAWASFTDRQPKKYTVINHGFVRDEIPSGLHPTEKPVTLFCRIIDDFTGKKNFVYDPFSGSGTTLIACEQLDRKCRAVEISPAYVAVALQRWAEMTGKEPVLLDE